MRSAGSQVIGRIFLGGYSAAQKRPWTTSPPGPGATDQRIEGSLAVKDAALGGAFPWPTAVEYAAHAAIEPVGCV